MAHLFLRRSSPLLVTALLLALIPAVPSGSRAADKEDQSIDMDQPNSSDENPAPAGRSPASERGYLGVSVQRLRHSLKQAFDIPDDVDGLIVSKVYNGSPADKAGLKDKDVILRFNGQPVSDEDDFTRMIRRSRPGSEATLSLWRQGRKLDLTTTLGKAGDDDGWTVLRNFGTGHGDAVAPETPELPEVPDLPDGSFFQNLFSDNGGHMGVQLQDLNSGIAPFFSLHEARGALVWEVIEDSPAQKAGVKAGDVITAVEGKPVQDSQDLREILQDHKAGESVAITVLRRGESQVLHVTLDEGNRGEYSLGALRGLRKMPNMPGYRYEIYRGGPKQKDARRSTEQLQREMDRLQQRMDQLKEDLDKLKD